MIKPINEIKPQKQKFKSGKRQRAENNLNLPKKGKKQYWGENNFYGKNESSNWVQAVSRKNVFWQKNQSLNEKQL